MTSWPQPSQPVGTYQRADLWLLEGVHRIEKDDDGEVWVDGYRVGFHPTGDFLLDIYPQDEP